MKFFLAVIISFSGFVAHSQSKYMFVFLSGNNHNSSLSEAQQDRLQTGHKNHIIKLTEEKKLKLAGSFEKGGGIFILNTNSVDTAREWMSEDPAVATKRYKTEILPWTPRLGSVCTAQHPMEYETYTFVRYNTYITKFNVRDAPQLFRQHDVYLKEIEKTGNVISEGVFDNSDGGTLIMKGEVAKAVIMNDPSVKNGIIDPEIKIIWVAKGSFCEHNN
ncbi:YciI family protein [Fulvivirga sediminis]|uniref:YCII-related domain-containing protein n=1 Tax=Fulvivirga sediminis TaxID=2803949 RepID=A0A937F7G3_9BACT|nr:hypothetical protein [Fulvivirga sediminis]MBL3657842.1 hypothetical protein [Fulvivirga sediminis]